MSHARAGLGRCGGPRLGPALQPRNESPNAKGLGPPIGWSPRRKPRGFVKAWGKPRHMALTQVWSAASVLPRLALELAEQALEFRAAAPAARPCPEALADLAGSPRLVQLQERQYLAQGDLKALANQIIGTHGRHPRLEQGQRTSGVASPRGPGGIRCSAGGLPGCG